MSLLNSDLIWVNRGFAPDKAGVYATAVLLRRVLTLMPGAVLVIMYPRVVASVEQGRLPDALLWKTALVVTVSTLALTALYFTAGPLIIELAFAAQYVSVAPLLGWMGVGMLGFGISAVWLNLYLATRPLPYVFLLVGMALSQHLVFASLHDTVEQVVVSFVTSGWILALGGLAIYLLVVRRQLMHNQKAGAA
jgi:hypothetical protein